jgi:P-type Ca2+ transporter type 2C
VAKEASDIVILDDNFSSIVKAVMWGRAVFDNIRKFLQFQLTVNAVALTLTFITALTGHEPPLNAVMMLWVNLIMDTLGALALGTEPPSPGLNNLMMRNIIVQFLFQIAVLAYLLFLGAEDFQVVPASKQHFTVIFNTFVMCQVFNEINARQIGDDMNIFKGLHKNPVFLGILVFIVVAQALMVEFGGDFVRTVPLTMDHWQKCILLGAMSLPIGGLMRLIPVKENESDFAEVSPLILASAEANKQQGEKEKSASGAGANKSKTEEDTSDRASFLIWLNLVLIIPVAFYVVFGESLTKHIILFLEMAELLG